MSEALAARNITLARVSPDEERASRDEAKLYREKLLHHKQWKQSKYAALKPEPERPRYAPVIKAGSIVAVDGRGQVYRLDERTTGARRGEIENRLGGIDASGLMNVTDAKAALIETRRAAQETERAQQRIDAPLGKTAGEIRTAWTLSRSQEQLKDALAERGMTIARVTPEEAKVSHFHRAIGNRSPVLEPGELVAVNSFGNVYRFDEHTTGQFRPEIEKRLGGIDASSLLSVADTAAKVREASKAAYRDEQDKQRPASGIEQKIIACREQAREHGATVQTWRHNGEIASGVDALADRLKPEKERQAESTTIHGDRAFAARLEQAGISIVRVTAADVKSLDQLRSDEDKERLAADVNGEARRSRSFAKVQEGELAAVTRTGNVFRLNKYRLDFTGLESAAIFSSTVPQSKRTAAGLPGVTEARARFETEGAKKTAFWDQRHAASAERRASREKSFGRQQTMRGAAKTVLRAGETANRSLNAAGKAGGIFGRAVSVFLSLFAAFDLFPAKPPSKHQQKLNQRAAEEQQATDEIAAKQEKTDEQRRQYRKTQENDPLLGQILGTTPTAQANLHRDEHDRQRERERDR